MAERDNILDFPLDRVRPANDAIERTPEVAANQDDLHFLYDGMLALVLDRTDGVAVGLGIEYVPGTDVISYSALTRSAHSSKELEFFEKYERVVLQKDSGDNITWQYEVSTARGSWRRLSVPDKNGSYFKDIVHLPPLRTEGAMLTEEVYSDHCEKIQQEVERRARVRRSTPPLGGRAIDAAAQDWAKSLGSPESQLQ